MSSENDPQKTWNHFLPRESILMGKKIQSKQLLSPDQLEDSLGDQSSSQGEARHALSEGGSDSLLRVQQDLFNCQRCRLCQKRTNIVLGEGNPRASLVFVGEGPGEQEDLQGRPFVGRAGQLLDRMILALGLTREEVFIGNVVKCRPPGNRNPEPDEVATCQPFLERQLAVIQPRVIVALGKFAAQTLLKTETPISALRGRFYPYGSQSKLMPTFHPAYLLRNPVAKKEVWKDLQCVAQELGLKIPSVQKT